MKRGQALVMLLVFMAIAVIVTSAAVVMMVVGSTAAAKYERGQSAFAAAESGIENALLRLLRDPNYSGETLTIGEATATITVTGADPKTIISTAVAGEFARTIQATAGYTEGILSVSSWKERF